MAPACLDLEFSTAIESHDEGGEEEVQIEIDSPPRSPTTREVPASGQDAKVPSARDMASSSSEGKGSDGVDESSSSDNSSYFVRDADPEALPSS